MHQKIIQLDSGNDPSTNPRKREFHEVLSLILGNKRGVLTAMAPRLGIDRSDLSRHVNGRSKPSQQVISENGWRAVFKECCPEAWVRHEQDFEIACVSLPVLKGAKYKTSERREPQHKDRFGCVLWQIIGGEQAHTTLAAKRLGIDQGYLSKIIHDQVGISQELIVKHSWEEVLASHYSENWEKFKDEFRRRAKMLPLLRYAKWGFVKTGRALRPSLRFAAADIVGRCLTFLSGGNDFEQGLTSAVKAAGNEILKDPVVWRQIRGSCDKVDAEIYVAALNEVCSLSEGNKTICNAALRLVDRTRKLGFVNTESAESAKEQAEKVLAGVEKKRAKPNCLGLV